METKSINSLKSEGQKKEKHGQFIKTYWFKWTCIGFGVLVLLTVAFQYSKVSIANRFIERGTNLLSQQKYIEALVQYKKADFLVNSEEINEKIELIDKAQKDAEELEMLWREENNTAALESLKNAKKVYDSEYDSVVMAKTYIENGQPQFAVIAAKTAIEMEDNYMDAWLYLGIAHLECLNKLELSEENYNYHRDEAKVALETAQTLSPDNEDIKKYMEGL